MANEDVNVLSLKVDLSGQTIGELRDGLKELKKVMNEAEIGTDDFVEASKALQAQETLLKEAMYEQKKAADDVGKSYNTLSAEMGRLKVEQKQLDLSTEAGVKAWGEYAVRINAINDELKALDATNGVYVRNVGDYANQFGKGFAQIAQNMPKWADNVKKPIDDIGKSAKLLATNPVVGVVTLLLPVITKITDGLKDNEQAMAGVHKMLEAVKPVLNILTNALEKAVGWVADMVSKLGDLAGEGTGTFKTIVTGAVGVGNAMLQFILTPIRTIIEAAKGLGHVFKDIFSGQFKQAADDAKTALSGIGDAFTKGFSFKANFEEGQRVGEEFAAGMKSDKVKKAATGAAKEVAAAVQEEVKAQTALTVDEVYKSLAKAEKVLEERRRQREQIAGEIEAEEQALADEINAIWEDNFKAEQAREKERAAVKKAGLAATKGIMDSLASILEAQGSEDEKAVKASKALRIASATMDMLQGAVTAFSTAQSLGPIAGPIVGAANAAAVVAAGMANIAKIRATNASKSGGASAPQVETPATATVSAPSYTYTPQEQLRTVTSASEEDRLNRMAADQRVYIVQSDIEAAGRASKVRVAESTF